MPLSTAITIGNFDGVHRGHAALIQAARDTVGDQGRVIALCFDPHPARILHPDSPSAGPARLSSFAEREAGLLDTGADEVIRLQPTPEFLGQSPDAFIASLTQQYGPKVIVEGPDFRFGQKRAGSVATLRKLEEKYGYKTMIIDPVETTLSDGLVVTISSTMIRNLLIQGRVGDVSRLLGRPYSLNCPIVMGDRRGRTIGFPTANLDPGDRLLPADGIYAGLAHRPDGANFPASISIGSKPTFGASPRTCEAFLIGYNGPVDDYGWIIQLEFHHWQRDQLKFSAIPALIEQIKRDTERTESLMDPLVTA